MADNNLKRLVSQEELDTAYQALSRRAPVPEATRPAPAVSEDATRGMGRDTLGLHLFPDRALAVYCSKKTAPEKAVALNAGYENLEALSSELTSQFGDVIAKTPISLTVSGKPARFLLSKVPQLAPAQMVKAFRLQLKQATGEDREDVAYVPLRRNPNTKDAQQAEYLVASIEKPMVDRVLAHFRKSKLRLQAWDADFLCLVRASGFLWNRAGLGGSTRFLVLLEWDHCYLIVVSPDGRLIAPRLSIGIQSFLEHLMSAREKNLPRSLDAKEWRVLPSDPIEVRQRKLLAAQAIHDVYVPFAQQIKTQLYAGCNDSAIPLPTHFAIVGPGADLFHVTESLAQDLNLSPVDVSRWVPSEMVTSLGAALWETKDLGLNVLPRGREETIKALKEFAKGLKDRLKRREKSGTARPSLKLDFGEGMKQKAVAAGLGVGMLALVGYPLWLRMQTSRAHDRAQTELASLKGEKERIAKCKEREDKLGKRVAMIKVIEGKRLPMDMAVKELLAVLPQQIKLQSLAFKDNTFTFKGLAQNEGAVQSFLKDAQNLKLIADPTPVGINRGKDGTEFELTFKFRI